MLNEYELRELKLLIRRASINDAKDHLWNFCNLLEPDFYTEEKPHLKIICNTLEDFYFGKLLKQDGKPYRKLILRVPPQHGKSRTLVNFTKWIFGQNQSERIITASNTDSQAGDFSRYTRDGISETKNLRDQIVYSDIFPDVKIKQGNASLQKWALEGQHFNYLGVGVEGQVTGKGATLRIMDDLIKSIDVALSDTALHKIWLWFSGTFSSRNAAEGGEVKEIFCATLWGENDPQYILEQTESGEWYVLSMPVINANGEMLCDKIMNRESYENHKKRSYQDSSTKMIFHANYLCEAITDNEMKVFNQDSIKRYKEFPKTFTDENGIEYNSFFQFAFADTADEGKDNFAMPIGRVYQELNLVYIHDCIFDQNNLTIQEDQLLGKIKEYGLHNLVIETNNAGAYFSRNMRKLAPDCEIFGQFSHLNKMSRILSYSGIIKLYFLFPENPNPDLQRFMNQLFRLMKTSKDLDDAPDSLSGMAAYLEKFYGMFSIK